MQVTSEDLRQLIKEELSAVLDEKKGKKTKAAKEKKSKKKKKAKKKDACYHKVKSRYDVWPSAYASGALVKCRKVGAANWGNSKNEGINEEFEKHDMFNPETGEKHKANAEDDHTSMAKKGYTHVDPNKIEKILRDEGGAAGLDPFLKEFGKENKEEIIKTLEDMPSVEKHEHGDYYLLEDLDEAKSYHWDEPDWVYGGGYGDGTLEEKKNQQKGKKRAAKVAKRKKTKKQASSEKNLGDWFDRQGEKGSKGGWVDCKAPDGDGGYSECAQGKRKKKPYCRPTPSACKSEPQKKE